MYLKVLAIVTLLQSTVIPYLVLPNVLAIQLSSLNPFELTTASSKDQCNCDISSKYIEIAQVDRSHIQNASVDEIVKQLHDTLNGNYKTIYDIMAKSKCNFGYVERGLENIQQRVLDIIEIITCPEQRNDKDRLDAAVDVFVCAKDCMIADMRAESQNLSQECADLFTKIRPAACNTGENIIFAVLNSLNK